MKLDLITDCIKLDIRDRVAYITFDDPQHMNPINAEAMRDLCQCLDVCEKDEQVRMVVFRGAGGNFSAGGNVKGMKERMDQGINTTKSGIRAGGELITRVRQLRKPTLAWIEGAAAGVGLSIAMACDFSLADEACKMTFAFINIGFIPDGGIVYLLSRAVGTVRATELLMSGRRFSGADARSWGLITDAVPGEQLEALAQKYIQKYSNGPGIAYEQLKGLINGACYGELGACMQNEVYAQYVCSLSEDHREAVHAFVEKRRPEFKGR